MRCRENRADGVLSAMTIWSYRRTVIVIAICLT